MTTADNATIVLEDGTALNKWKSYAINSNFLVPTDGWDFTFGTDVEWKKVKPLLKPDRRVQIFVDGVLQMTGWIDSRTAECSSDGGTTIHVHGRDILKPLCKSNIRPGFAIKGKTIQQVVEEVLKQIYIDGVPTLFTDGDANRLVISDPNAKYLKHSHSHATSARRARMGTAIEYYQAHAQEGAFEFLSRILRKNGLWLWATAEGGIVVSGPDYEQPPLFALHRKSGDAESCVLHSSHTWDATDLPSLVVVHGKSTSKDWETQTVKGVQQSYDWLLYSPIYIRHDEAATNEECVNFAAQEMSRLRQHEVVYSCTVRGHRNTLTNALYQPNTIGHVVDEALQVDADAWVLERTFRKSVDGGTTTDLKLLPPYAVQFSEVDAP